MTFDEVFDRLIGHEGGLVDDPHDPGGLTRYGISQRSYPGLDIQALTLDQARAIYLRDFWQGGGLDKIAPALAFQVFDAGVNHGVGTAVRMLQRAAGVAEDGNLGPVTLAALRARSLTDMLMLFIAVRLEFWTQLSTWPNFGKGWSRRAATNLRYAAQDS